MSSNFSKDIKKLETKLESASKAYSECMALFVENWFKN